MIENHKGKNRCETSETKAVSTPWDALWVYY